MKSKAVSIKSNKWFFLLYAVLVVVQGLLTTETAPPTLFRLTYLVLAVAPAIINPSFLPGVLALLYTISVYGFSYNYMPAENHWYVAIVLIVFLFHPKINQRTHFDIPGNIIALMIYVGVIEFIYSFSISSICIILLLVVLLLRITSKDDDLAIKILSLGFSVASFTLSLLFFIYGSRFAVSYDKSFERVIWLDANYFGMAICLGTIASLFELVRQQFLFKWEKWLYFATLVIVVPTLIANGSRGAILAIVSSGAILLLFSKVKRFYKFLFLVASAVFLFFIYTSSSIFDFFLYRLQNEELREGTGRIEIWQVKLNGFSDSGFIKEIFGMGSEQGLTLGYGQTIISGSNTKVGFHSDFVGYLVKYGFVGLILFLSLLTVPFKYCKKGDKSFPLVLSGVVAIVSFSFTLEPYSSGGTSFWLFYMYILMISMSKTYSI